MAVFSVQYRPSGDPTLVDPNIVLVRELLIVQDDAILIVTGAATVCITAGDAGKFVEIKTNSTMEFG